MLNCAVAAQMLLTPLSAPAADLDSLFERLAVPDLAEWQSIERQIARAFAESGSPAMDLLLQRGQAAMDAEDFDTAIAHFTALVDHAPEFPEAYNARATAYFAAKLYGPAFADVMQALALEPRHFGAWQGLGVMLRETGQNELALDAFRRAAAIHPNRPEIRESLERLEKEVGGQDI